MIAKQHPLANTPIHQCFPIMGSCINCLTGCCVDKEKRRQKMADLRKLIKDEKKELNDRMDMVFAKQGIVFEGNAEKSKSFEIPNEDEEDTADYDPYGQLGFGFTAYFSSMQIFACLFLCLTVIMLPAFGIFASAGGLKTSSHGYYNSAWMLGNMGFNKAVCISNFVELNSTRTIGCEVGVMQDYKYAGIIPDNIANYATNSSLPYGYCGNPNATDAPFS